MNSNARIPGIRLLHSPGPTHVPDEVVHAMSRQPTDLGDVRVVQLIEACESGLKRLLDTTCAEVFFYAANGHGGWEAVIANMVGPGTSILVPGTGHFSNSWAEQVEAFGGRTVAVRAVPAWLGQGAAVGANFVGGQTVDVGVSVADQSRGEVVQPFEVVGGVEKPVVPIEPQPADVALDRFDVLDVFLGGIGIVEAQVADTARLFEGDAEIEADALRVADVEIAVRFGREAGDDATPVLAGRAVVGDDLPDEIEPVGVSGRRSVHGELRRCASMRSWLRRCGASPASTN